MRTRLLALGAGLLLLACGGNTDSGNGGGGGSGATSGGGTGGTGATGGGGTGGTAGSPSGCPASQPSGGDACTKPSLRCTYGDDVRPECRSDWTCMNGAWTTTKAMCLQPGPGVCPAAPPTSGTVCANDGSACSWPDGTICGCSSCEGMCSPPPPKWHCSPPPTTAGCPAIVPNDGSACSASEGTQCTYGNPCGVSGATVICTKGAWLWQLNQACPA